MTALVAEERCKHCGVPVEPLHHILAGVLLNRWTHRSGNWYHVKCRRMDTKAEPETELQGSTD